MGYYTPSLASFWDYDRRDTIPPMQLSIAPSNQKNSECQSVQKARDFTISPSVGDGYYGDVRIVKIDKIVINQINRLKVKSSNVGVDKDGGDIGESEKCEAEKGQILTYQESVRNLQEIRRLYQQRQTQKSGRNISWVCNSV